MAFLDNSGDIILDAALTKTGRLRMAQGRFKITKFALGDDEINYILWNGDAGSVYQDLNILRSPVFEAATEVGINHHLVTRERNDILYLPILKLNELEGAYAEGKSRAGADDTNNGFFVVLCNQNTVDQFQVSDSALNATYTSLPDFVINGLTAKTAAAGKLITLEQGLDTEEISFSVPLEADLEETSFHVYIDDRFGEVVSPTGVTAPKLSVDANETAHYFVEGDEYFHLGRPPSGVYDQGLSVIRGPRGLICKISIKASPALLRSTFLFKKFGRTDSVWFTNTTGASNDTYTSADIIETTARIVGTRQRFAVDIPLRFVRHT